MVPWEASRLRIAHTRFELDFDSASITGNNARTQFMKSRAVKDLFSRLVVFASRDSIDGVFDTWSVIAFCDPASYVHQDGDYIYAPTTAPLTINHLHNVVIALAAARIDFVIISHGLEALPLVKMGVRRDALIIRHELIDVLLHDRPLPTGCCGRFVRLVPPPVESALVPKDISDVLGAPCCVKDSYVTVGFRPKSPHLEPLLKLAASRASALSLDKLTVLVMPAMFAVGGVERNTIDVIRVLQSRYRFIVVTNEPHLTDRGSLHEELRGITAGVFDLAELATPAQYVDILGSVREIYGIDLVWICNGSSWLVANAEALRKKFSDVPIVDQQVYDTKEGWITHFDKLSLRSFDRYVAINEPIRTSFVNRLGIAADKVDLIYPAIDANRFRRLRVCPNTTAGTLRKSLEVPHGINLFAMIGRLTRQKRPKDFLELALRARAANLPDVFLLIGQGELAVECHSFVQTHRLDNVRFVEHCPDPSRLYPEISGLLIMSEFEGLPIVSLEAMAMGGPVLATDVGDLRKIFAEHRVGHLFTTIGDPAVQFDEFCAWRETLPDHSKRAATAADGVRHRFSSQAVAKLYDDCFRRAKADRRVLSSSAAQGPHMELASLSVVLPTFNRSTLLRNNLQRCAELSRGLDIEFIVVDDGSADETNLRLAEMAQQVSNLTWRRIPNSGPGQARNIGASIACKDVILFIGDDIEPLDDEFFRVHARLHARNRNANFAVLGKIVWPQHVGTNFVMAHIQGRGGEQYGYADMLPFRFYGYRFFYTSNVSIKRTIVEDWLEEGFSKEFKLAGYEDAEFAYRMQKEARRFKYLL